MLIAEQLAENILKVKVSGQLEKSDFTKITALVDELINRHGKLKLLIDATAFNGWSDMHAVSQHFAFVRDHQMQIDRVALIAGYAWQHWLAGMANVFMHPDIKVFDSGQSAEAEAWLKQGQ